MRRDVYIENDSGGFSVVAAEAVDAIIEDARDDDWRFVQARQAMLLTLVGDDSMVVRVVADEPLRADEQAQWLARARGRIATRDGNVLVMGGFDPDVLTWWRDEAGGLGDGRGVGFFTVPPGTWDVDVYAHVGSMNGRAILDEGQEPLGAAFRRSHPGRPFPLWLAHRLDYSGDDDPGFETLWRDVRASVAEGRLAVDTDAPDPVGLLVHFTRAEGPGAEPPEDAWLDAGTGRRMPGEFPLGIGAEVPDRGLIDYRNRLLGRRQPEPPRPTAQGFKPLIDAWPGEPLEPVAGRAVRLPVTDAYLLHWMAALTADASPHFELRITHAPGWAAPASTPDFAVASGADGTIAIGPVPNTSGWHTWWTARDVATALDGLPEGARLDLAMVRQPDDAWDDGDADDAEVGMARYTAVLRDGAWRIGHASPALDAETLAQALAFVREATGEGTLTVHRGPERQAFDAQARLFAGEPDAVSWRGDRVTIADDEVRTRILLTQPVFRERYGGTWPMAAPPDAEDDDEA